MHAKFAFVATTLLILAVSASAYQKIELKKFNIDQTQMSVSGLSSGAFMAVQYHVAFSKQMMGAGVFAGGPYDCAQGQVATALTTCLKFPLGIQLSMLYNVVSSSASSGKIDDPSHLSADQVYLFSGTKDDVVEHGVVEKLEEFYAHYLSSSNIETVYNISAAHGMVTDSYGNSCGTFGSPYINNCDYDGAGALLQHIYAGSLQPRTNFTGNKDNLFLFDQTKYTGSHARMYNQGFVYVPTACQQGEECKLHIVFHGCQQSMQEINDQYAADTGYNGWAEANNIIVLYPQTEKSGLDNPQGCWDWWGYTNKQYYLQSGPQMAAVQAMQSTLTGAN